MVKSLITGKAFQVAELIRAYREASFSVLDGIEATDDAVFALLQKGRFGDTVKLYPAAVASLHKLLHHEDVAQTMRVVLKAEERSSVIKLLYYLHAFFSLLGEERYIARFEELWVRIHQADGCLPKLLEIEAVYKAKLDAVLSHRGQSA